MMTATPQGGSVSDHGDKGPALPTTMNVWRCWKCGRIIARLFLVPGCAVEIKCRCTAVNIAAVDTDKVPA
jgi:phage FluMu protein Com